MRMYLFKLKLAHANWLTLYFVKLLFKWPDIITMSCFTLSIIKMNVTVKPFINILKVQDKQNCITCLVLSYNYIMCFLCQITNEKSSVLQA